MIFDGIVVFVFAIAVVCGVFPGQRHGGSPNGADMPCWLPQTGDAGAHLAHNGDCHFGPDQPPAKGAIAARME